MTQTKQAKLLKHLKAGKSLTATQIATKFDIAHPASAVRNLREQGHPIDGTTFTQKGSSVFKYFM